MKRYAVELSPQAEEEILEAAKYIAQDSLRHAERWLDEIYEAIATLRTAQEEDSLRSRPDI
jgi:plasmid stabilization system protein ParE